MSGHTPGPWIQDDTHGRRFINRAGTGETVAITAKVDGKDGWMQADANARLIATAPDLLEALQGMMKCFDGGVGEHWNAEELDAARAAIARAKGEA